MSSRFCVRTVRRGAVKIGWVVYRVKEQCRRYDGRLDGQRFAFGRYPAPWQPGGYEPFVSLWGTERAFRCRGELTDEITDGPHIVDGSLPWEWWEAT